MRSVRLGLLELRRIFSTRPVRLAVCVVAMVPLLYGGLYLWAFWDPYSRLDMLPIAVVNLDQPVSANGQTVQAGVDLLTNLEESDSFDWQTMSAEEAAQKLDDGSYQLSLTIPDNFSAALVSASGDTPERAELQVADTGTNILVTQIADRVLEEVRTAVSSKASATYLDNIYVSLSDFSENLETAATSADQLADGMKTAEEGAQDLQQGLTTAGSGADTLDSGLASLESGAENLTSGSSTVADGASTLAANLSTAASGASSLATGVSSAASGEAELAAGLAKLDTSGDTLVNSVAALTAAADQVSTGAEAAVVAGRQATAASDQLASGAESLSSLLSGLAAAHPEFANDPTFAAAVAAGSQVAAGASQLATGIAATTQGMQQVAEGVDSLKTGSTALSQGLSTYTAGVTTAAVSSGKISAGLNTLADGGQTLASGLSAAQAGASTLANGTAQLASGTEALQTGAGSAVAGVERLSSALDTLAEGSGSLAAGVGEGAEGAQKLASGLSDATSLVPNDSASERETRTQIMASPVALDETTTHEVPNYGTGFAPYFIPLALWVGALMAFFVIRPLCARSLSSTASNLTVVLSGYWPAAALTTAQAVIMMLVLQFALGLQPVNVPLFYVFGILVSLVCTAIMQFLSGSMGTAGKFIAVVLLMLQLTSAAGTFPLETVPHFFQVINPYLPMTYVVLGLRQVITTGDIAAWAGNVGILLAFGVVAMAATYLTVWRRRVWTMERLKPEFTI